MTLLMGLLKLLRVRTTVLTILASTLVASLAVHAQTTTTAPTAPTTPMAAPGQPSTKPATVGKPLTPATTKPATLVAAASAETLPLWKELTPTQQASLKPLAAKWSTIDEAQKRKWIALSNNYAALPAPEQQKMHGRMAEWASLSQQQRSQARLNFAESNKLVPKEKAEKAATKAADWEAYQALSPEDKQKLAAKAVPKPSGAATALKPSPPEKLATVPLTRNSPKGDERGNRVSAVEGNALQPKAAGAADASGGSAVQKN